MSSSSSSSSTQSIPFFQYHHQNRPQYQSAEQSPTISTSKMLLTKELSSCDRVRSNTLDFLSAPKRKRDDGIDAISLRQFPPRDKIMAMMTLCTRCTSVPYPPPACADPRSACDLTEKPASSESSLLTCFSHL